MAISLQMIVKDEFESVRDLLVSATPYFDHFNITVSDKTTYNKLKKLSNDFTQKTTFQYREWTDNFSEARNDNFKLCKTRYAFWLDADDAFDFSRIPELVKMAENNGYEAIYLPYDYARDEHGRTTLLHWRERLVDMKTGFVWRGALHETLLVDHEFLMKRLEEPRVIHTSPNIERSVQRNHKILLKEAEKDPVDPRVLHYLGLSYATLGEHVQALETLKAYVRVGGWDEEIYRSLLKMSDLSSIIKDNEDARLYAAQAMITLPTYPQAYYALAQIEFADEQWDETLHYLKVATSTPMPKSMSLIDPTLEERGKVIGACAEFQRGNYSDAVAILKTANDPAVAKLLPNFEFEASKQRFTEIAPALTKHIDEKILWEGLTEDLKYDNRMKWLRESVVEPKKWPKKSIVYFCGQSYEEWGPNTEDRGMGGSEEAVVNLSRQWAQLGYHVTIYGAVNEETIDKDAHVMHVSQAPVYKPWRMFDPRDEFDTLIIWRAPRGVDKLKARVKILDIHDKLEAKDVPAYDDVTYAFKSEYHRNLYPHVKKAVVIGNGINKGGFDVSAR